MEATLMVEGIGSWSNFDEIEDSLVLDELLLLHETLGKSRRHHYRVLASFQGIDLGDSEEENDSSEELPPEVLAAEREWQEKKRKAIESGASAEAQMAALGLGYKKE
jgi:hypothetical protein